MRKLGKAQDGKQWIGPSGYAGSNKVVAKPKIISSAGTTTQKSLPGKTEVEEDMFDYTARYSPSDLVNANSQLPWEEPQGGGLVSFDPIGDAVNPLLTIEGLVNIPGDIAEGNYISAGMSALEALPFAGSAIRGLKRTRFPHITNSKLGVKQIPGFTNVDEIGSIYKPKKITDKEIEMYKWFEKQKKLDALPKTTNKKTSGVLEDFKTRIQTLEGKKRMKELGIDSDEMLQKIQIVEDPNTFGYFSGDRNRAVLNPSDPLPTQTARHEIEHGVQNAFQKQAIENEGKILPTIKRLFTDPLLKKPLPKTITHANTKIDDLLSGLELRKKGTLDIKRDYSNIKDNSPVDISQYKSLISDKQKATDYFLTGSEGREKSAFLAEVQQYMMDNNIIPKTSYTKVTPEMVHDTFADAMFDETGGGKYLRLFNIMKPSDANYKLIAEGLNKMLGIVPGAIIGVGAASQQEYQDGGNIDYNLNRAEELGYTPDETGHLPSVDYTNGMWLKSKKHPTAFMEFLQATLNPELQNQQVVVNPEGYFGNEQLQYIPRKQSGGTNSPIIVRDPKDPRLQAYQDSLMLHKISYKGKEAIENLSPLEAIKWIDKYGPATSKLIKEYKTKLFQNPIINDWSPNYPMVTIQPEGTAKSKFAGMNLAYATYYKKPEQSYILEKDIIRTLEPIYVTNPNDPRLNQYTEEGRQFLYKKPINTKIIDNNTLEELYIPDKIQLRHINKIENFPRKIEFSPLDIPMQKPERNPPRKFYYGKDEKQEKRRLAGKPYTITNSTGHDIRVVSGDRRLGSPEDNTIGYNRGQAFVEGERIEDFDSKFLKKQKGGENFIDMKYKASNYPYRIQDEAKRNQHIKDLFFDELDSIPREYLIDDNIVIAKNNFKSRYRDYGSDRGYDVGENYPGFDYKDYDQMLDRLVEEYFEELYRDKPLFRETSSILPLSKKRLKKQLKRQEGGNSPIVDPRGQYNHPGKTTRIPSNRITMKDVGYPVLGITNKGTAAVMFPGEEYLYTGADFVDEIPLGR